MYSGLIKNTTQLSMTFSNPGTAVQDPVTYVITYEGKTSFDVMGNFVDLTTTQIAARQQIQVDSRYKVVIEDNTLNRTIPATWTVTIESVVYEITGRPRKPQFSNGWITVYLKKKGA